MDIKKEIHNFDETYLHFLERPYHKNKLYNIHIPNFILFVLEPFRKEFFSTPTRNKSGKTIFIQWKLSKEKNKIFKESNSRLVTWNNGSRSIVIGDKVFDVEESYLPPDRNYLFAKCKTAKKTLNKVYYQAHGTIKSKFILNVLNSEDRIQEITNFHKMKPQTLNRSKTLTITIGEKSKKSLLFFIYFI